MIEQLLDILKEGRSVTLPELAVRLEASEEEVLAGIEFLMQTGYLTRVAMKSGCGGSCPGCAGEYQPGCPPVMWEYIK